MRVLIVEDEPYMAEAICDGLRLEAIAADIAGDGNTAVELLSINAIVHNLPEQGTVWITTSVHPRGAMLTVENTGEKLPPQLVSTLTEPFQRGTERIRNDHAGVGLGLAIVKSITQAHDGTLTVAPRTGGGLHLTVQLPATPTHTGRLNRLPLLSRH